MEAQKSFLSYLSSLLTCDLTLSCPLDATYHFSPRYSFFKYRFYLFILREREREGEREGEKHRCVRQTWVGCSDRGLKWSPFRWRDDGQPTEPQWPWLSSLFYQVMSSLKRKSSSQPMQFPGTTTVKKVMVRLNTLTLGRM